MDKIYLSQNLKYLRRTDARKPTQADMAAMLGVSISTYGAYEEGRAEPKLENLHRITGFFGIEMERLVAVDLSKDGKGEEKPSSPNRHESGPSVLALTLSPDGEDNIEWVPEKAAAGYTRGFSNPEFISGLPVFRLPVLDKQRKYRAFTIQGDSMLPVPSGAMVFGEYADDWNALRDGTYCVLITRNEGIVFKKLYNYLSRQGCFLLVSTNKVFEPYLLDAAEVLEIWKFAGYYTERFPEGEGS